MARRMERGEHEAPVVCAAPIDPDYRDAGKLVRGVSRGRRAPDQGDSESNRRIGLIERPDCKRRWQSEPWEVREARRLTTWLLDKCEDRSLWYDGDDPRPMTVNRLADRLRTDAEVITQPASSRAHETLEVPAAARNHYHCDICMIKRERLRGTPLGMQ